MTLYCVASDDPSHAPNVSLTAVYKSYKCNINMRDSAVLYNVMGRLFCRYVSIYIEHTQCVVEVVCGGWTRYHSMCQFGCM